MAHTDFTRFIDEILISNYCLNPLLIDCTEVWQSMQAISDCLKCFNGILNLFTFKPFLLFLFFQVKSDDVFKFFVSLFWCYLFGTISSNSFLLLSVESSFLVSKMSFCDYNIIKRVSWYFLIYSKFSINLNFFYFCE